MNAKRVAVVTGGLGDIGWAIGAHLVSEGLRVVLIDSAHEDLAMARLSGHEEMTFVQADCTNSDSATRAVASVIDQCARLDVVVHCASGPVVMSDFAETTPAQWSLSMSSLTATISMTHAALPHLLEGEHPRIVAIGSLSSTGTAGMAVYSAAKAGIEGFTRALAQELGAVGVTVNTVAPGPVAGARQRSKSAKVVAQRLASIPQGRFASVSEVAYAVGTFVRPDASYISGQTLFVSGAAGVTG